MKLVLSVCLLCIISCSALPTFLNATQVAASPSESCKGWDWFYCPKDPGCATYTMSAHEVSVSTAPARLNTVMVGHWVNLYVIGTTTIQNVSEVASYKVYGIDGKNSAAGLLAGRHGLWTDGPKGLGASLELNFEKKPGQFRLQVPIIVSDNNFEETAAKEQYVNFGIDIFLQGKYVQEAMCVQIANSAYAKFESSKEGFVTNCKDNGDGTFTKGDTPDVSSPLSGCNEGRGRSHQCGGCFTLCNPQSRSATLAARSVER